MADSACKQQHKKVLRGDHIVEGYVSSGSLPMHHPDEASHDSGSVPIATLPFSPQLLRTVADVRRDLHSSPSSKETLASNICPMCKGAGWLRRDVPYGHPDFDIRVACVCKRRDLREKQLRKMIVLSEQFGLQRTQVLATYQRQVKGVQKAYYETKVMIDHLQAWARQSEAVGQPQEMPPLPREWLVMRGPTGTGKTHLAMAITNACIDAGIVALFAFVPDLLDHLRAAYSPESAVMYDTLFEQMKNAEVLALDDLGSQRSSSWANEKIFQLINYRYNFGWPTIITLKERVWDFLDERIRSRLQDAGLVLLVDMQDAQNYSLHQGKHTAWRRVQHAATE